MNIKRRLAYYNGKEDERALEALTAAEAGAEADDSGDTDGKLWKAKAHFIVLPRKKIIQVNRSTDCS